MWVFFNWLFFQFLSAFLPAKCEVISNIRGVYGITEKTTDSVPHDRFTAKDHSDALTPLQHCRKQYYEQEKILKRNLNITSNSTEQNVISNSKTGFTARRRKEQLFWRRGVILAVVVPHLARTAEANRTSNQEKQKVDFSVPSRHRLPKTNMTETL